MNKILYMFIFFATAASQCFTEDSAPLTMPPSPIHRAATEAPKPALAVSYNSLDGKTFEGEYGPIGKPATDKTLLEFNDYRFMASSFVKTNYQPGYYQTTEDNQTINFSSDIFSSSDGMIQWRGKVTGGDIEGKFSWTRPGSFPEPYWFKGSVKNNSNLKKGQ